MRKRGQQPPIDGNKTGWKEEGKTVEVGTDGAGQDMVCVGVCAQV
jgi:hypothetical protein